MSVAIFGPSLEAGQRARFVPSSSIENRPAEEVNPFRGMKAPVRKKSQLALKKQVSKERAPKEVAKRQIEQVAATFEEAEEPKATEDAGALRWQSRSAEREPQRLERQTTKPRPSARIASAEPREFVVPKKAARLNGNAKPNAPTVKKRAPKRRPANRDEKKRPTRSRKFDPFEEELERQSPKPLVAPLSKKRRVPARNQRKHSANDGTVAFQSEQYLFDDDRDGDPGNKFILSDNFRKDNFRNAASRVRKKIRGMARETESAIETDYKTEVEQAGFHSLPLDSAYGCPDCGYAECSCDGGYGPACGCGDPGCGGCGYGICHKWPRFLPRPREFTLFAGVHAFKGPLDGNRDSGNFGFQEGFNWGGKLPWRGLGGVGYQIGYQLTHSQLHGSTAGGSDALHTQQFITAGLFRRPPCGGLQYGVVWDVLRDERFGSVDYHQVRSEIGLINHRGREIGLQIAVHANDTSSTNVAFQSTDQFLVYYRIHAQRGGEARFFGGLDDDAAGILGADMQMPVNNRMSIAGGFTYLIPQEGAGPQAASEEAWNLGLNLVWHLGNRARSCHRNLYRPLFNVADNGSLIVDNH